ncbi:hypothetical protein EI94DRAFT_1703573 [Lactarius quietus]|nr:hypothetical protein EI94DRAFT_1703573 [Lactarius quietus]
MTIPSHAARIHLRSVTPSEFATAKVPNPASCDAPSFENAGEERFLPKHRGRGACTVDNVVYAACGYRRLSRCTEHLPRGAMTAALSLKDCERSVGRAAVTKLLVKLK